MRSFFPESEDYLPPPQARFVKPFHTDIGDAAQRWLQQIASRGKVGLVLVTATIVIGFAVAGSAMAAGNHTSQSAATPRASATACVAVNCNPWGYNFSKGKKITHSPAAFCRYFKCISNFPKGKGYVEECKDGMYSRSGGHAGSCADHHGNWRPLLAP